MEARMKAIRDFAMADPDDCDREWAAYLALVSNHETAANSSPSASTSSLHSGLGDPTTTATASSAPSSTAPLRVPSSTVPIRGISEQAVATPSPTSTPASKDDLSPGARCIYDLLVGGSSTSTSTVYLLAQSSDMSSTAPASTTSDISTMLRVPTELDGVPGTTIFATSSSSTCAATSTHVPTLVALDSTRASDLAATSTHQMEPGSVMPTTCSTICPAGNTSAKTTPASSTTASSMLSSPAEIEDLVDLTVSAPTICLPGGSFHSISGEDPVHVTPWNVHTVLKVPPRNSPRPPVVSLIVPGLFTWSPICSTDCLCCGIKTSFRILSDTYMEFSIGPNASTMAPWPPPSCTCAGPPLIRGQNLFQHAQQKHGKEFSVMDSKGNWIAIWLDVELKPPWSFLGVCMNLPMGWIYQHIFQGNTHYSEQMQWSFSHSVLQFQFCTALVQSENFWKINLVPLKSWFQCCCAQRESIYGCENFQWTIAWSLSCPFSQSISWSFSCPPWEDELLPDSTRRVFLSSSEKCQLKIARLLDYAFTEWKPWPSRVCFCVVYVSTSACGPGVPLFWWFQFAIKNSLVFRDKLLLNIKIQLQPWPSWQESNYTLASKRVRIQWSILNVNWALEELSRMTNWASEEEKGKLLLSVPWLSFRCHWVAACPALLGKIPPGHPHEDPYGFAGSFVLHWTSFSDETQMHLFTETFCYKLFAIWETRDCLQYEHLQQWRPPHQLTSVACIGALFLRSKDCWSDIHWAQLFVIEHWLIPWEPGNDSRGHNLMICVTITCELLYSVDDKLQADRYLCLSMRCVQVDTDGSGSCVSFLQPKPPWLLLAPTIYASGFKSYLTIASESVHITSVSLEINQCGVTAIHGSRAYGCLDFARKLTGQNFICLLGLYSSYVQYITQDTHYFGFQQTATSALPKKQPIGGHCKFYDAFLFSWDLTSTIDSVPAVKYISGGSVPVLDSATCVSWNNTPQQFLHLTWDPGGYRQHPLEGKPDFKEGGLSTTCLQELSHGPPHWAVACVAARYEDREAYIPMERPHQDLAWNEQNRWPRPGRRG